jgi:hypothetical protein
LGNNEIESFFKKYNQLVSERQSLNALHQEIAEFCYPTMANFTRYITNQSGHTARPIYDATAEHSNDLFASSIMSLLCNPASKWLVLESENQELNKSYEIQNFLDELQDYCLSVFNNPQNRFYDNIFIALKSVGAFGLCPVVMENDKDTILKFKAETPKNYYFEEDFQGNITTHYFEYQITGENLFEFKKTKNWLIPETLDRDKQHFVIRKICFNKNYNSSYGGFDYAKYHSYHFLKNEKIKIFEDFFNECPVAVARWDKINGTKWSDSPARVALADVKMINLTQKDTIKAIELMLNPPMAISSESQIGKIDLSPNAIMVVQGDSRMSMSPVNTVGNVPMILEWQAQVRESIRTSFFIDVFMTAENVDMTATEANIRYQEKLRNIGPKITRLQTDLLGACVDRLIVVILSSGVLKIPNALQQNSNLNVRYVSPIASAYRQQEALSIMNYLNNLNMLATIELNTTGQSTVTDCIDYDIIARELADIAGIKTKALLDTEAVQAKRELKAEAQQRQQEMNNAQQLSEVAKNLPQEQKK